MAAECGINLSLIPAPYVAWYIMALIYLSCSGVCGESPRGGEELIGFRGPPLTPLAVICRWGLHTVPDSKWRLHVVTFNCHEDCVPAKIAGYIANEQVI